MNALNAHWEKMVLGLVSILLIVILVLAYLGKTDTDEFSAVKEVDLIATTGSAITVPDLIEIAGEKAPVELENAAFTHPWLQRSTADFKLLTRMWSIVCDETGERIQYKDDVDGDGIPNETEIKYGLLWNDPKDGPLDLDGDGLSNLQEHKMGTDLKDPSDPNIVGEEYRVAKIYRPARLIKLSVISQAVKPFVFVVKDGKRTSSKYVKAGDIIQVAKKDRFKIGDLTIDTTNIFDKSINRNIKVDNSYVDVTDLDTGEVFQTVLRKECFEKIVQADIVALKSGEEKTVVVGDVLPILLVKADAKVKKIDDQAQKIDFVVGKITYSLKPE